MNILDLKLKLLKGSEIKGDGFKLKPFTLGEIVEYGYSKYSYNIALLTTNPKDFLKDGANIGEINLYDFAISINDDDFLIKFLESLMFVFNVKQDSVEIVEQNAMRFGDNLIHSRNYNEFVEILKYQNCITEPNEEEKPREFKSEFEKKMWERIQEGRKMAKQAHKSSGENLDLFNIISAVSTRSSNYNKNTIWDCTLFQLYDEYKRLQKIDGYETSVKILTSGFASEDAKKNMEHWASKYDD